MELSDNFFPTQLNSDETMSKNNFFSEAMFCLILFVSTDFENIILRKTPVFVDVKLL